MSRVLIIYGVKKVKLDKVYWTVVWNETTGEFKVALLKDNSNNLEELTAKFEMNNPEYRVIHIGEGNLPPKTYRSLEYVN